MGKWRRIAIHRYYQGVAAFGRKPLKSPNSLLKYAAERRVRARGLHDFPGNHGSCRPGALTGRIFQQSAKPDISYFGEAPAEPFARRNAGSAGASPYLDLCQTFEAGVKYPG